MCYVIIIVTLILANVILFGWASASADARSGIDQIFEDERNK